MVFNAGGELGAINPVLIGQGRSVGGDQEDGPFCGGEEDLFSLFRKMHGINRRERFLLYLPGMIKSVTFDYK